MIWTRVLTRIFLMAYWWSRVRIKLRKRGGLPFVYLMIWQSIAVKQLLSKQFCLYYVGRVMILAIQNHSKITSCTPLVWESGGVWEFGVPKSSPILESWFLFSPHVTKWQLVKQILWYLRSFPIGSLQWWKFRCSSGLYSYWLCYSAYLVIIVTVNNKEHQLQAAVYGVGLCAEYGGSVFKPLVGGRLLCSCFVSVFVQSCFLVCFLMGVIFQFLLCRSSF